MDFGFKNIKDEKKLIYNKIMTTPSNVISSAISSAASLKISSVADMSAKPIS